MKYFKNTETGEVFGYDETYSNDEELIQSAIKAGWEDISDTWDGKFEPNNIQETQVPTKEELMAKLLEIQAQLQGME